VRKKYRLLLLTVLLSLKRRSTGRLVAWLDHAMMRVSEETEYIYPELAAKLRS
jgi:hypothetical protein